MTCCSLAPNGTMDFVGRIQVTVSPCAAVTKAVYVRACARGGVKPTKKDLSCERLFFQTRLHDVPPTKALALTPSKRVGAPHPRRSVVSVPLPSILKFTCLAC